MCVEDQEGKVRGLLAGASLSLQVWAGLGEGCYCVGCAHECVC